MSKNQFYYTVIDFSGKSVGMGSFNMDYVIRSINYAKDKLVILLDDFHEVSQMKDMQEGKKVVKRNIKENINSEIFLNEEDSMRYFTASSVDDYVKPEIVDNKEIETQIHEPSMANVE